MALGPRKEGNPLGKLLDYSRRIQLSEALVAICKARHQDAHAEKANLMSLQTSAVRVYPEAVFEVLSLDLEMEVDEAKKEEREWYKAYRKAKTFVRKILSNYWFNRIRFASRAIGNESDYSLKMVATPPTTVPADEYVMNYVFDIRQQGGVRVGCLS